MTNSEKETPQNISAFICTQIQRLVPSEKSLSEKTDITTDVSIDSLGVMDLVFALEEEFDVSIPLNILTETRTIGDLASLVKKLQSERA